MRPGQTANGLKPVSDSRTNHMAAQRMTRVVTAMIPWGADLFLDLVESERAIISP
jgi:hypothetical protein